MSKTNELNKARRRLAFDLATQADMLFESDRWDVDDATDLFAALIPDTRAEAQQENEAFWEAMQEAVPAQKPSAASRLREAVSSPGEQLSIREMLERATELVNHVKKIDPIVDKLQKDAEGRPIYIGRDAWVTSRMDGVVQVCIRAVSKGFEGKISISTTFHGTTYYGYAPEEIHSTRESAEAATHAAKIETDPPKDA